MQALFTKQTMVLHRSYLNNQPANCQTFSSTWITMIQTSYPITFETACEVNWCTKSMHHIETKLQYFIITADNVLLLLLTIKSRNIIVSQSMFVSLHKDNKPIVS